MSASITCAIVVCDNGLGHLRRAALFAQALFLKGFKPTLFCTRLKYEHVLNSITGLNKYSTKDISLPTLDSRLDYGKDYLLDAWKDKLSELSNFDLVISDNYPEILQIQPTTILSANFFWHDILKEKHPYYYDYCQELLLRHEPLVIGSKHFAMPLVKEQSNYKSIGIISNHIQLSREIQQDSLLLTGGSTSVMKEKMQEIAESILKINKHDIPYKYIYIDPSIYENDMPDYVKKASFSYSELSRIKTAIIRPGLGIISDLLKHKPKIHCVLENNREIQHNYNSLKRLTNTIDITDYAYEAINEFVIKEYYSKSEYSEEVSTDLFFGLNDFTKHLTDWLA